MMKKMKINKDNIWKSGQKYPSDIVHYKRTQLESQRAHFKKLYNEASDRKKAIFRYILDKNRKQKHKLHVVSPSPWPIYSAASAFLFVLGMVLWMHGYTSIPLLCGIISVISAFIFWFRDIIREGVYMGYHTSIVNSCLRLGFILFLVSEVMFFFGFFWALFHFSLTPSVFSGNIWPPQGIVIYLLSENILEPNHHLNKVLKTQVPLLCREEHPGLSTFFQDPTDFDGFTSRFYRRKRFKNPKHLHNFVFTDGFAKFICDYSTYNQPVEIWRYGYSTFWINLYSSGVLINPYNIPLLNTAILITSGGFLTVAHMFLKTEKFRGALRMLIVTILLGLWFIALQAGEYATSGFSMNDGIYGSIFFMLTGFHGFHVIVGTIFLIVCACRMRLSHFTANNHFALEAAAWYWHFVDIVWILLYFFLYLWPNARYFETLPEISFDPYERSIFIQMTMDQFFRYCKYEPGFKFPANINLENNYPVKAQIISGIMGLFGDHILEYEQSRAERFQPIKSFFIGRLFNKLRIYNIMKYSFKFNYQKF